MNIKIKFPDGSVKEHPKFISPLEIAESISHGLAKQTVVAEINGRLVDLDFKIEGDAEIKLYKFESKEGQEVYWHSTAHLLAQAVKGLFPKVKVAIGPAIENGFYYDFDKEVPFTDKDLEKIEQKMKELSKENAIYNRQELTKAEAIKLFAEMKEDYKVELLE